MENYILVIDSGNGGGYTLHYLRKECINENFLFLKDIHNAPYGNKTKKELLRISINNIDKIKQKYNIKAVVFACNTLSTTILNEIKSHYKNMLILGVKPLIKQKKGKNTLVLSTTATLKLGHIDKNYQNVSNVFFVSFDDLAKRIDNNISDLNKLLPYLKQRLNTISNIDYCTLGCTHYNLIKPLLKQILGDNVVFYENSPAVAKRLKELLKKYDTETHSQKQGKTIILTSAE